MVLTSPSSSFPISQSVAPRSTQVLGVDVWKPSRFFPSLNSYIQVTDAYLIYFQTISQIQPSLPSAAITPVRAYIISLLVLTPASSLVST